MLRVSRDLLTVPCSVPSGLIVSVRLIPSAHVEIKNTDMKECCLFLWSIYKTKIDKNNAIYIPKYNKNEENLFMGTENRNPFMGIDEEIPLWDLNS